MHRKSAKKDVMILSVAQGPSVKSPEYANNRVKKLVIYYNITATLCKSFCDVITRVR